MPGDRLIRAYVRDFARKHKIDLSNVEAKTIDGELTLVDVADYACKTLKDSDIRFEALAEQFKWNRGGESASSVAGPTHHRGQRVFALHELRQFPVDAKARNPLVDAVRAAATAERTVMPGGNPPELFASGALPAFTASGIPPQALLEVPWQARHAMAMAPTAADAYEISATCNLDGDPEGMAQGFYGNSDGNRDYETRVTRWQFASMSEASLRDCSQAGAQEERDRRQMAKTKAFNDTLRPFEADSQSVFDRLFARD